MAQAATLKYLHTSKCCTFFYIFSRACRERPGLEDRDQFRSSFVLQLAVLSLLLPGGGRGAADGSHSGPTVPTELKKKKKVLSPAPDRRSRRQPKTFQSRARERERRENFCEAWICERGERERGKDPLAATLSLRTSGQSLSHGRFSRGSWNTILRLDLVCVEQRGKRSTK